MYKFLVQLNWAIYEDTVPQHLAYQSGGLPAIEKMALQGFVKPLQLQAWRELDAARNLGDPKLKEQGIRQATIDLLLSEQKDLAQKYYSDPTTYQMFQFLSDNQLYKQQITSPVPGDNNSFRVVVPTRADGQTPNLARFADRWAWITAPTDGTAPGKVGMFDNWWKWSSNPQNNHISAADLHISGKTFYAEIHLQGGLFDTLAHIPDILTWRPQ